MLLMRWSAMTSGRRCAPNSRSCWTANSSVLPAQSGEEDVGAVVVAGKAGVQPFVAVLALELPVAIDLVGDAGAQIVAVIRALGADIVVVAIAGLRKADQPAAEGVLNLDTDIAVKN